MAPHPQRFLLFFALVLLLSGWGVSPRHHHHRRMKSQKLFVFGDSYVDTGNVDRSVANSWSYPYGITFPGKPAGRFSDGRVLTDYLAMAMGIRSPVAYRWRRCGGTEHGMNFAYGGTGVFDTLVPEPNMTAQIDFFEQLLRSSFYTSSDLSSSVALVTLAGNDYGAFIARKGSSFMGLLEFIPVVVQQLESNLRRLREMGVGKVAVTSLQPLGCLPMNTASNYFSSCNDVENMGVGVHNGLLKKGVMRMKDGGVALLDLYTAFMGALMEGEGEKMLLRPCCRGVSNGSACGSVNGEGERLYEVCDNPHQFFFWDNVHPTQRGWEAVSSSLRHTFKAFAAHVFL